MNKTSISQALRRFWKTATGRNEFNGNENPFTVAQALAGAQLVTRSGKKAELYNISNEQNVMFPVRVIIEGIEGFVSLTSNGRYFNDNVSSDLDVFLKDQQPDPVSTFKINDLVRIRTNTRVEDYHHRDHLVMDDTIKDMFAIIHEILISSIPGRPNLAKLCINQQHGVRHVWCLLDDLELAAITW